MFTLKLYQQDEVRVTECESATIYRWENGSVQITAHQKDAQQDCAYSIGPPPLAVLESSLIFDKAIVENGAGKTTEIVTPRPASPAKTSDSGRTLKEWQDWMRDHPHAIAPKPDAAS